MQTGINPFYAAHGQRAIRNQRVAHCPSSLPRPIYARLPVAPLNASPVPHLTSLYHFDRAGEYGDRGYPGNCGGNLIKDLLRYFQPASVLDPMTGSGTCRDVCEELGIYCWSGDMHQASTRATPRSFPAGASSSAGFTRRTGG